MRQNFAKDIGIIGLTNFFIALKGIILLPIITKLLGANNYGIWIQLSITLSLIAPLAVLGLPFSLVRFLPGQIDKKEIRESIYSTLFAVLILSLTAALILITLANQIGQLFQVPPILIKILALTIILECLNSVLYSIFRAFRRIKLYSSLTILQNFGEIGLIVLTIVSGYGLLGASLSLLIIRLIIFLTLMIFLSVDFGIIIPNFQFLKKSFAFGLPTVASNIAYWTVTSSDRYLIGFFLGALFVGYYSPGYTLGNTLTFLVYPLSFMLPVALAKLFDAKEIAEIKIYLRYSLKYFLMAAVPAVFGLTVLAKPLLILFSTPEIASRSYLVAPIVASSILLYGVYTVFTQALMLVKKTKTFGNIWTASAVLNIGLNLFFIPKFGILGAALTTLISYLFSFILTWHYSFKELSFQIDWKFILKSFLASGLMSIFLILFRPAGLVGISLTIFLGGFLYFSLIFLFRGFNSKEFDLLKSLIRTREYKG